MASLTKSDIAAPMVDAACSMSSLAAVEYAKVKRKTNFICPKWKIYKHLQPSGVKSEFYHSYPKKILYIYFWYDVHLLNMRDLSCNNHIFQTTSHFFFQEVISLNLLSILTYVRNFQEKCLSTMYFIYNNSVSQCQSRFTDTIVY